MAKIDGHIEIVGGGDVTTITARLKFEDFETAMAFRDRLVAFLKEHQEEPAPAAPGE